MRAFKVGCDPELFLEDAAHSLKSAVGLVGGSKMNPRPIVALGNGFAVQEDNVAVEFNTPPAENEDQFDHDVASIVSYLENAINSHYKFKFSKLSAAFFPRDQLMDPAALEFGCDPDFNVWTGRTNPKPKAPDATLRSCGGHLHIGASFKNNAERIRAVKLMELCAGVPSVLIDDGDLRKGLYGKSGAHRMKEYGPEYRVLSNFWVFDKHLRRWAFNSVKHAMSLLDTEFNVNALRKNIVTAINTSDKDMAWSLVKEHNIPMPT